MEKESWAKLEIVMKKKFGKTADEMDCVDLLCNMSQISGEIRGEEDRKKKKILEIIDDIMQGYMWSGVAEAHSISPEDKEKVVEKAVRKLADAGLK